MNITDKELIEKCSEWISRLCKSGGNAWSPLSVPVNETKDPDTLFTELIKRFEEREKPEREKELLMDFMLWYAGDETMSMERTQEIEKIVDIWLSPEPIIDNKTASWYKALDLSKKIHSGEYKIEDSFNKLINPQTDGE